VWRVPKLTSFSTVAFIRAALTGAMIARSFASGDGGGAAPIRAKADKATKHRIATLPQSALSFRQAQRERKG
jgi:hypothetical protein